MTTLSVFRGDDVPISATITESINGAAATPLDLTGAVITATINGNPGWTGTATIVSAVAGTCSLAVPAATMAQFTPGDYMMDLQVVKGGIKRTAGIYEFKVTADITLT